MANAYIELPLDRLEMLLCDHGFEPDRSGNEVTYRRVSRKNSKLSLVVYSSVATGKLSARGCGEDAIRVVLIGDKGPDRRNPKQRYYGGLFTKKILRVNSVEGILERVFQACKEAAFEGDKYLNQCPHCQGIAYSDSGKCVNRECREKYTPAVNPSGLCPECHEWHPCARELKPILPGQPVHTIPVEPPAYVMCDHRIRSGKKAGKMCEGLYKRPDGVRVPTAPAKK